MRGQSEIIVFVLLFIIGVFLFMSSVIWSRGVFDRNAEMAKLNAAEQFMINLDNKIQNIVKFGGHDSINYGIDAPIEFIGTDTIEINTPLSIELPASWTTIASDYSIVKEKMQGDVLKIQLYYPVKEYGVYLYTEGSTKATPERVLLEKTGSFKEDSVTFIKVMVTFK